ncbi:MAG: DUF3843 family protein, partial [Bacteroidales bacterium]|nr:DUF3843 family protein [Bacteroidales bacterium]
IIAQILILLLVKTINFSIMNKPIDRIYIKQWLALKPYEYQVKTDSYYLKLCNEVKKAIVNNERSFVLHMYINIENIDLLSCFLTSYFEDLISGTNIWNSFINVHKRLYSKQLPFFDLDEYYEEEINLQDVCFLIWYFLNTLQQEKFISPINDFIDEIAESVMAVFDKAWEFAPENGLLKSFYNINNDETDYYAARDFIDRVLFNTYLFYPDTLLFLREKEAVVIEENEKKEYLQASLNDARDNIIHKSHTKLLGLTGKEWVAEILGKNHPLSNDFSNISQKIIGYFLYKGQDDDNIFLEHIASGKKFNLTKKSFDRYEDFTEIDTILYIGIVKWRGEWWFSGVLFQIEFNQDLVFDEKNSDESRMAVNFIDHNENDMDELLNNQFNAFKDLNNGLQIAFMESDKIEHFLKNYTEYYNKSLNLSKKAKKEAKERAKNDNYFGGEDYKTTDFSEISESALIFFNPKSGVEIALAVNSAFPSANNPFFNEEESEDHIFRLFMAEDLSAELSMFCIDNYKSKLPFFKEKEGQIYLNDIDFLLRFWKNSNYFTKPTVTFIGTKS